MKASFQDLKPSASCKAGIKVCTLTLPRSARLSLTRTERRSAAVWLVRHVPSTVTQGLDVTTHTTLTLLTAA